MAFADARPDHLTADEGYDSAAIRDDLSSRGISPVIPPPSARNADSLELARLSSKELHRAHDQPYAGQPRRRDTMRQSRQFGP